MCGIAGWIDTLGRGIDTEMLSRMLDAQKHRGPDGSGTWSDSICVLGHRRLAIIDLSETGRQPMCNEDRTVWVTTNGEIYNFAVLRKELEGLGHGFNGRSDTEVIVHAYEQWGPECVKRFRGMFAFALWDQKKRRLLLARDRAGKKPLFYTSCEDRILFASELQGLLACPKVSREVNASAIDAYLSWGYVPAPHTAFKNVFKLPPGHYLTIDVTDTGAVTRIERYWSLQYQPKLQLSEDEAIDAVREKLTDAVRLRLVSDVPLGAFLSGGIDSSIVVGLMASLSDTRVKTFSVGFDEEDYNELAHARRVAERWGTDHTEFVVKPDALQVLPGLVRHYGEPFADSSAIPTYYVSRVTRSNATVALNGDGGDESFAGYDRYRGNLIAEQFKSIPGALPSVAVLQGLVPGSLNTRGRLHRAKRFLSAAGSPMPRRYAKWIGYHTPEEKQSLYSASFRSMLNGFNPMQWMETLFEAAGPLDPVDAAMAVDVNSYLPYDLLVKVDITSMANSLEARSPFLDHELMEFAARLPVDLKLRGSRSKYLLKRAFRDLLPSENASRRKMGFAVPVGKWFRGELREFLTETLLSGEALKDGYVDPATAARLVTEHITGRADHGSSLWNLLMLELWRKEFIRT